MTSIHALLITCCCCAIAMSAEGPDIAKWKGDRAGAYSLTFDDGWKGQVDNTLSIIDPLGLKGTFFFMPLAMEKNAKAHADWAQAKAMQANGHEIGTHGQVKPKLHEADAATLDAVVNGGYQLIADKTGIPPVSFALPGGSQLTDAVKAKIDEHHLVIRKPPTWPELMEVASYGETGPRKWKHAKEQAKVEAAMAAGKWRIAVIHAIVKGYSPFPSKAAFQQWCEWLKSQEDQLWIAPLGTIARYVAARKACTLTVSKQTAQGCELGLSCPEDQATLFTEALTIVVQCNASQASAVDAAGNALPLTLRDGKLLVDIMPGSTATLTW